MIEHELRVLKTLAGEDDETVWGSWVGACIEFLQEDGYVNRNWDLTQKGKDYLEKLKNEVQ